MSDAADQSIMALTAQIVAAYVGNNAVDQRDLSSLIGDVHAALCRLGVEAPVEEIERLKPAVPIAKSIAPDYLVCLEDGKKFKSLKRHLRAKYNMSPEDYRAKWGLKPDYPMVAPSYAQARSDLARKMGLGTRKPD